MRNLAKELGVYPTAIYWHIPTRNAIITVLKRMGELTEDEIAEVVSAWTGVPVTRPLLRLPTRKQRATIGTHWI